MPPLHAADGVSKGGRTDHLRFARCCPLRQPLPRRGFYLFRNSTGAKRFDNILSAKKTCVRQELAAEEAARTMAEDEAKRLAEEHARKEEAEARRRHDEEEAAAKAAAEGRSIPAFGPSCRLIDCRCGVSVPGLGLVHQTSQRPHLLVPCRGDSTANKKRGRRAFGERGGRGSSCRSGRRGTPPQNPRGTRAEGRGGPPNQGGGNR